MRRIPSGGYVGEVVLVGETEGWVVAHSRGPAVSLLRRIASGVYLGEVVLVGETDGWPYRRPVLAAVLNPNEPTDEVAGQFWREASVAARAAREERRRRDARRLAQEAWRRRKRGSANQ